MTEPMAVRLGLEYAVDFVRRRAARNVDQDVQATGSI